MMNFFRFTPPWRGKQNKAFTLVETLVALSIFSVSILALMSVLASGISNTKYAQQKMSAAYLAQEGIECIRNTRDNYVLFAGHTWAEFRDISNFEDSIPCPSVLPGFDRTLSKDTIDLDEVKVTSEVSWTQGSGGSVTFSENLTSWAD